MANFFKSLAKGLAGTISGVAGKIPIVGDLVSTAVDGLVGSFTSDSDARASLRAQHELLQKQQQFSHDEAVLNRQFQKDMFKLTNDYNTPKAQMSRMIAAGLNPDLMYGGNGSSVAAQSPSGSQASAPSPGSVPPSVTDNALRSAEIARINAETSLIKSQTKNTDASTAGQLTFNDFQAQLLTGQIESQNVQIKLGTAQVSLTDAEQKKLYKEITKLEKEAAALDASLKEISARTSNLNADTYMKRVQTFLNGSLVKAQISEMASRVHLNYTQARTLVQDVLIKSRLADSQISLNQSQENVNYLNALGIDYNNQRLEIDLSIDKGTTSDSRFRAYERRLQASGTVSKELYTLTQQFLELF